MVLRLVLISCALGLVALGTSPALADGKLSRARDEAHGTSQRSSSNSSDSRSSERHHHRHSHGHGHHDCDDRPFFEGLMCAVLPCDCTSSSDVDYETDTYVSGTDEPQATYASYPYATSRSAYVLEPELEVASTSATLDAQLLSEHTFGRPWAGQLSLDAGFMSGIGRTSLDARVMMPGPLELGARNSLLWEPAARDYSLLGSAVLGIRFLQTPAALMRFTVGVAYFGQVDGLAAGPEVGIGLDLFLGRPWVLSLNAATALVGQTFAPQARIQLGYLFGRTEIFAGYQYLRIGSVGLSTPLLGTRIWL